jgi:hypothetical protein
VDSKRKLDQSNMIIFASQKNYAIGFGGVPLHQINYFLNQTIFGSDKQYEDGFILAIALTLKHT